MSKVKIHNVVILDASSSMWGEKYNNALRGLNEEMSELRTDENAEYTQTVVEFSNSGSVTEHCFMKPLSQIESISGRGASGNTALYETVGNTIEKVLLAAPKGEHILVKIFTDGEENGSQGRFRDAKELQKLINIAEKANVTVTFEGTKFDAEKAVQNMGIKTSNVLVHNNTAENIYSNSKTRGMQSKMYSAAVASGASMDSFGFYQKPEAKDMGDIMQELHSKKFGVEDKTRDEEENKI